jgi:hypothetical protein
MFSEEMGKTLFDSKLFLFVLNLKLKQYFYESGL